MKTRPVLIILLCASLMAAAAGAQEEDEYKKHPGYLDMSFAEKYGEPKSSVEIFLTPGLAKLIAGFDEDKSFEDVLKNLSLIKSYTFALNVKNRKELASKVAELSKILRRKKWQRFINIQDPESTSQVFLKETRDEIQGMVILSLSKDEVTFVNIVGVIDLDSMSKLGKKFDIPELDSLNRKK